MEHGTLTAVLGDARFEITTLRVDVKSDGRHAEVAFTKDWKADAKRRDFTMNALYASADGTIHDPLGVGLKDLEKGLVRFIGEPQARIQEDYLRILRFFRCSALYATAPLHKKSLEACFANQEGMRALSAERIQSEILKLLAAPRAPEMITQMAEGGLWRTLFPESQRISLHASLHKKESDNFLPHDPLLGFAAFFENAAAAQKAARRLKMSNRSIRSASIGRMEKKGKSNPICRCAKCAAFSIAGGRKVFRIASFWHGRQTPKKPMSCDGARFWRWGRAGKSRIFR